MKTQRRALEGALSELGALLLQAHLTVSDVARLAMLRLRVGARLRREHRSMLRIAHQMAFATRGVGVYPSGGALRRLRRARLRLAAAELALGHPMYADLGARRVRELLGGHTP